MLCYVASERKQQAVDYRADARGGHKARGRRRGAGGCGSTSREVAALNALDRAEQRVRAHRATGVAPSLAFVPRLPGRYWHWKPRSKCKTAPEKRFLVEMKGAELEQAKGGSEVKR